MGIAGFIISTILAVWVVIKEIRDHIEWNTIHNPLRMNIIHVQNGTKYLSYEYSEYKLKIPTIDEQVIGLRIEAKKELSLSKIQIRLVAGNKRWPSLRRHHPTLKNIIGYLSVNRPLLVPLKSWHSQVN